MGKRITYNVNEALRIAESTILQKQIRGDAIPRFSQKHETIADYLQSREFKESKPEFQRRVLKQAYERPAAWTLAEARGHSKPTGNTWQVSDETGLLSGRQEFKNRKIESMYAEYQSAISKSLAAGDDTAIQEWKKSWGKAAKDFTLQDGTKVKPVTDLQTLTRLHEVDELPSGAELYLKG